VPQSGRCDPDLQKRLVEQDRIAKDGPGALYAWSAPGFAIQDHTTTRNPMKFNTSDRLPQVTLYALQACAHCREAKIFLQQHQIAFRTVYMDLLVGEERNETMRRLRSLNPASSFPTITVNQEVIVGFKEEKLRRVLSLPSKERLQPS
jgi:glutaredoxin-like protein NrdH